MAKDTTKTPPKDDDRFTWGGFTVVEPKDQPKPKPAPKRSYRQKLAGLVGGAYHLYSEDQARDDHGRWTDEGGAAGGSDSDSGKGDAAPTSDEAKATVDSLKSSIVLETGKAVGVVKKMGGNSNASYIVEMEDGNNGFYKPEAGETWHGDFANRDISRLITNKDFSLAEREAFGSSVSVGLGFGEFVPETHLREEFDVPGLDQIQPDPDDEDDIGGGYDEDYARELYSEYKQKALEDAMDEVGQQMGEQFADEQARYADAAIERGDEVAQIWQEMIDAGHGPADQPGAREHPALPMGSKEPFARRESKEIDILQVLKEANIDPTEGELNQREDDRVREILRQRIADGYDVLGEVNRTDAENELDYSDWMEQHQATEARLMESKIQDFDSWRHDRGMYSDEGGGGRQRNPDAPHPTGGSLQRFLTGARRDGHMTHEDATKFAVLDYVLGSMDRHPNNIMFKDGKAYAIDNGYSMPGDDVDDFQFRSEGVVEWMSDPQSYDVPKATRDKILASLNSTDWKAMVDRHPSMSQKEKDSFLGRVVNMKKALSHGNGLSTLWQNLDLMNKPFRRR